ncbi:MAG TPA: LAGLIDADG family homing endonuclease, partial [Candidatus Norongarragalinales archaeon]|nr:LAGLIDADG family homing endonuclease [Candidatus Norongarragalinales archaeon]
TEAITRNSHEFRPLGIGYANLGALLMSEGLAYDGDDGRNFAAAITALLSGHAYYVSTLIAKKLGAFGGYAANEKPFLNVISMHRDAAYSIPEENVDQNVLREAREAWDAALESGKKNGFRNSQISVLAPTGCLVGDSLVSTDRGLVRLSTLGNANGDRWQDVDFAVSTDEGNKRATKFFINGVEATRKIKTSAGYEIQGTLKHKIKVVDKQSGKLVWKKFAEVEKGDVVPLALNTIIGDPKAVALPPLGEYYWAGNSEAKVPRNVTPELAELVGYFMGDGSLHSKGLRFCVSQEDQDVVAHLAELVKKLFNLDAHVSQQTGYIEVAVHNVPLVIWWEACGFAKKPHDDGGTGKGYTPHIPDSILYANDKKVYSAFLRGLFEADGTVTNGAPTWTTACKSFSNDVKSMMLALGYPTTTKIDVSGWGQSDIYATRIRNFSFNTQFLNEIGFIGMRKTKLVAVQSAYQAGKNDLIYLPSDVACNQNASESLRKNAIQSFKRNSAVSRQLAVQLYKEIHDERLVQSMKFFYDAVGSNEDGGEQPTFDLSVPENVTYTANGFVSHNTIGFLMDCDTTGVEPDIALIKYKWLVGGGLMKIVNTTVPLALEKLGYKQNEIVDIMGYLNEHETIEGAPHLKQAHLPVFDCAFKPSKGIRSIQYLGHVRMMAAVQPFISGAISKTVNLPADATAGDIENAYMQAWKGGLKAIAIYRDGSKRTQPLTTSKTESKARGAEERIVYMPMRQRLPDERQAITHKFAIAGHEGYITVGLYEDGRPGELFVTMAKEGSTISGLMDAFSTAVSIALQYGVPLKVLAKKFSNMRFEPSGVTGNEQIRFAKSITDYIFKWLAFKFLGDGDLEDLGFNPEERNSLQTKLDASLHRTLADKVTPQYSESGVPTEKILKDESKVRFVEQGKEEKTFENQSDAPVCDDCGSIMVRSGSCYKCFNCGSTSGCS